jgi:hypothetical protein
LLVHELAHLRRGDHWVRRLELVALGLYWWHPAAWWARRELEDAEERCCDGWVARLLPGAGPAYAAALVQTVAFLSAARAALPLGASGSGQARHIRRRVIMILEGNTARPLGRAALLAVLIVGLALLALAPGRADPPAAVPAATVVLTQEGQQTAPRPSAEERDDKSILRVRLLDAKRRAAQDARPASGPPASPAAHPEQVEAAREEVELLEAQLSVKQAQVTAAKLAVEAATPPMRRAEEMFKRGAINVEDFEKSKLEVRTREMELLIRQAEVREPEIRLKQARRRLAALDGSAAEAPQSGAGDARRLTDMEKKIDELRRQVELIRKEMRNERSGKKGADSSSARPAGLERAPTRREQRMIRWTIQFDTQTGEEYLRQLQGAGAILAVPKTPDGREYWVIRDLKSKPAKLLDEDVSKIERIFWLDDKPRSMESLGRALGLAQVPSRVVAFLPEETEKKLFEAEKGFRGAKEEEIEETTFQFKVTGGGVPPRCRGATAQVVAPESGVRRAEGRNGVAPERRTRQRPGRGRAGAGSVCN